MTKLTMQIGLKIPSQFLFKMQAFKQGVDGTQSTDGLHNGFAPVMSYHRQLIHLPSA